MSWMDKEAEGEGKKFAIAPQGSHLATLVAIIDLGTHEEEFQGKVRNERQISLVWELANEIEEGTTNRLLVSQKYNFSANPKARLRLMLEGWRGRKYNEGDPMQLSKVLGQPCLVTVVHKQSIKGRDYAIVTSVSGLPKGMKSVPPVRPLVARKCDSHDPIPEWIPYIMGEKPYDVLERAHENRPPDYKPKHTSANANDAYPPSANGQQTIGATHESEIPF